MSDHADVIREALRRAVSNDPWGTDHAGYRDALTAAIAALDALVAALERGDSLLDQCGREHAAMFVRVEAAEAERDALRKWADRMPPAPSTYPWTYTPALAKEEA